MSSKMDGGVQSKLNQVLMVAQDEEFTIVTIVNVS
jgi:hypothetical protein